MTSLVHSLSTSGYVGLAAYGTAIVAALVALGFASRHMRTAPASFGLAAAAGCACSLWGFWRASGMDFYGSGATPVPGLVYAMIAASVLILVGMIALISSGGPDPEDIPVAKGSDPTAHIATLCSMMRSAKAELARTDALVGSDRRTRREAGLSARIADAFVTTEAEAADTNARVRQAGIEKALRAAVPPWVSSRTDSLVSADPIAAAHWERLKRDEAPLAASYNAAVRVDDAAIAAISALDSALSAIGSARSWEYADLASSSKGVSAASSMQTAAANTAVSTANQCISYLKGLVGQHHAPVAGAGGTFDLVMDMSGFSGLDFSSVMALGSLGRSRDACSSARADVVAFRVHSERAREAAWRILSAKRAEIDELRSPFKAAAVSEMPSEARAFV